jgi:hypothetical protein
MYVPGQGNMNKTWILGNVSWKISFSCTLKGIIVGSKECIRDMITYNPTSLSGLRWLEDTTEIIRRDK